MSLARALTTRLRRNAGSHSVSPMPTEASRMPKRTASTVDRSKISGPVELISSTNMLSYNAPDVATVRQMRNISSSASSTNSLSADDSDNSSVDNGDSSELTDASSVEASPCEPEPNHLSCYFEAAQDISKKGLQRSASAASARSDMLAPAIPRRALSHSKKSHIALARKRSLQSTNSQSRRSGSLSRSSSLQERRTSTDMFTSNHDSAHPFGKELEKLSEVVEEFGGMVRDVEQEDDIQVMQEQGLSKWSADDYLLELQPLYLSNFTGANHPTAMTPAWI